MKNIRIKNQTDDSADLYIYGDIVDDGWGFGSDVIPTAVRNELDVLKGKALNVYINSGGGDVFASTAIHNMLLRHDGKTIGYVDGLAASGASVILMACDEICVPENAYVMIHRPSAGCWGDVDDMLKMAELLDTVQQAIMTTYKLHSDLSDDALNALIDAETWMTGKVFAEKFGKGVTVTEALQVAACATDMTYRNRPQDLMHDDTRSKEIDIALALANS